VAGANSDHLFAWSIVDSGLAWAVDRDETSTAQQFGSYAAVSSRRPVWGGVVVNVPASLHGTVMPPLDGPIRAPHCGGP
jgi:hypothetical protein